MPCVVLCCLVLPSKTVLSLASLSLCLVLAEAYVCVCVSLGHSYHISAHFLVLDVTVLLPAGRLAVPGRTLPRLAGKALRLP